MIKDCTDFYAWGIQYQSIFHHLRRKKMIGNSCYPEEIIGSETHKNISNGKFGKGVGYVPI